jgi:DNA-binding CsgD family transcriptional regulator
VTEVEQRATHLDLATLGDDESIARVLDEAAGRANERGAPEAAAEYAERAVRRTAEGDALTRRRISAAGYRMRAGDLGHSRAWLEEAVADAAPGALRAEALMRLGEVRLLGDDWREAERLLDEVLDEADLDIPLRIEAIVRRAGVSFVTRRHLERGLALITEGFRLAEASGDPKLLARVIGPYATWQWDVGGHHDLDALERCAAGLGTAGDYLRVADHFDADFASIKSFGADHRGARALWDGLIARAEERGDYSSIPQILVAQTRADFYAGRAGDALVRLEEAEAVARITGHGNALMAALQERVIVSARMGHPEAAWAAVRAAHAQTAAMGIADVGVLRLREELAALELSRGNYEAALDALGPEAVFDADTDAMDSTLPTRAEALIRLGRLDEAEAVLERFRGRAVGRRALHHASADIDAGVSRVSALLAAARGDLEQAKRLIDEALAAYATSNDLWSRARALLVAADIHRRSRRRSKARIAGSEARALFEHFGAALWAERARELLDRIGAARADAGLTPTQAQVAELAIEGLTNRQIGERLFMSIHTVEAHLSAAYRILNIRSRRELGSAIRDSPE